MRAVYLVEPLQPLLDKNMNLLCERQVIKRIWQQDHTVWKPDPTEISNRLGWLSIHEQIQEEIPRLETFAADLQRDGIKQVLLLGMGGSSLAPEMFSKTFSKPDQPGLEILDSTHPQIIKAYSQNYSPQTSLYIVATKSGGTLETLSLFQYFFHQVEESLGRDKAGKHFAGITDPGSRLVNIGNEANFREIFLNDPNIGGRYSALSFFGLVPAAVIGVDLHQILMHAKKISKTCQASPSGTKNPAAFLGAVLGTAAEKGRNKITLTASPSISYFPNWIEQLLAESTGKQGKGILPVIEQTLGPPSVYGNDRLFVDLNLSGESSQSAALDALEDAGHPVIQIELSNLHQLGGQFFLWEMATAVAGAMMGIHPFNQPNVESAKVLAKKMVEVYQQEGSLPEGHFNPPDPSLLDPFLQENIQPGSYLAIHAYLPPDDETTRALGRLQETITKTYQIPVTIGYGPRFLHSTGQLHKGDAGKGLFLQMIDQPEVDLVIPDQEKADQPNLTFGTLIRAQALGDAAALRDRERAVLQYQLDMDPVAFMNRLIDSVI